MATISLVACIFYFNSIFVVKMYLSKTIIIELKAASWIKGFVSVKLLWFFFSNLSKISQQSGIVVRRLESYQVIVVIDSPSITYIELISEKLVYMCHMCTVTIPSRIKDVFQYLYQRNVFKLK